MFSGLGYVPAPNLTHEQVQYLSGGYYCIMYILDKMFYR